MDSIILTVTVTIRALLKQCVVPLSRKVNNVFERIINIKLVITTNIICYSFTEMKQNK